MESINLSAIITDQLSLPLLSDKQIQADVLRLDKIHSLISGNKWFKLRYYLADAKKQNCKTIITWGGAWSNHILASAAACQAEGLKSIGIIRGERPATFSTTLINAAGLGMQFVFLPREEYRAKKIPQDLLSSENYFIPEGGYGSKGAHGAATILEHCKQDVYTHICCATGTGTMMAGLVTASFPEQQVLGISVMKNNFELEKQISDLLPSSQKNFTLCHDYHFGGYAQHKPELLAFMNNFYRETNIPSDFVYTGKLFYAISELISRDFFSGGSRLLLVHSGGLQGNDSLGKGTLIF